MSEIDKASLNGAANDEPISENISRYLIGQYFVKEKGIPPTVLDAAIKIHRITGKKIGKVLIELGAVTYQELVDFLSKHNPDALVEERAVFSSIKGSILKRYKAVVLSETDDSLFIAAVDPEIKGILEKSLGKKVYLKPLELNTLHEQLRLLHGDSTTLNINNPNHLIDFLIKQTITQNGSDIHIETIADMTAIRIRKDGVLHLTDVLPRHIGDTLIARIKGLAGMDIAEKKFPQDGAFKYNVSNAKTIDLRVSSMPSIAGESVVVRLLDKDKVQTKLDNLGIKRLDLWRTAINSRNGIILVTGPTGAGKTTTLYATILELDRLGRNIITIEDPVEYQFPFVRQVQVNRLLNLDFATFLKHSLRQDPDVILVGEIRDPETAKTAIRAAETGHLVFATIHSNDIISTFSRLKDLGVNYADMKYTLRCVMSQLLIRKVCPKCDGKGCDFCDFTGYKGRILISETLLVTPDVVALMEKGITPKYETMYENAMELVEKGITNMDEVRRFFTYEQQQGKAV